jgi:hypothetical protein
MSVIVSSFISFPNIYWWTVICGADTVWLDKAEHFEKMSYRNRYKIAGANGVINLSIPIEKGRNNRAPMRDIKISNSERWQMQHWRSIISAYNRTPFFEYYAHNLEKLFTEQFTYLIDFNLASIHWLKDETKLLFAEQFPEEYVKDFETPTIDLRSLKPSHLRNNNDFPKYYQVFSEKNGFAPNLSLLDLLFSEGPHTKQWILDNRKIISPAAF